MGKLKLWNLQQDAILTTVSKSTNSKKWKKASEELKRHGFERTDIQCRQRYVNHLDPTVNKESWTDDELQILYTKYGEYGNKWFLIQKHLPGRTQTKIKNYFYGNIRYLLKIIVKVVIGKNRAGFVNDLKTDTLLEMYEGTGDYAEENIIQRSIKNLMFRKIIEDNMQAFQHFGKKYLMVKQVKQKTEVKAQEEGYSIGQEDEDESEQVQKPLKCSKVEVVSITEGEVSDKDSQLAYLQKMAKLHYEWFLHFKQLTLETHQQIKLNIK